MIIRHGIAPVTTALHAPANAVYLFVFSILDFTSPITEDDGENCQHEAQRFARRAACEDCRDPAHHRCPRFQSSIRAWMATATPISATAMNTQRMVSR